MSENKAAIYISDLKSVASSLSHEELSARIEEITKRRIAEIEATETEVVISGKAYYVSEKGDDRNDGLSPETPWRTPARVTEAKKSGELCEGDGVFFKRGEAFRGTVETANGVTYSAYGEGDKPRMYGYERNVGDSSLWQETDVPKVWRYEKICTLDIGNIVFEKKTNARKVYRSLEEDGRELDYRRKVEFHDYRDLTEDLSFWHDWELDMANGVSGYVYLRCEAGNPGEVYSDIEFTPRTSIFRNLKTYNVTIDNFCISNSNFGVSGLCHGETVQNCIFKWIGGCVQCAPCKFSPSRRFPTPYGNGIEIYGEAQDFTVDNCYFWQIYDAAMTHQCGSKGNTELHNRNVSYRNNVCEYCVYSVEIFYGESELDNRSNDGCTVENNILRLGGGFGHLARPDENVTALIRNGRMLANTTNYVVRNNLFDRSLGKIVQAQNDGASKAQYFSNLYVQTRGSKFCSRLGRDFFAVDGIRDELFATGTEHDGVFVVVEE